MVVASRFGHDAPVDEKDGAQSVPDVPETRKIWLSDFKDDELRYVLRALLEAGLVEMTLDGKERAFRLTVIGRMEADAFSTGSLCN